MLPSPVITRKLLTNGAYGFPRGGVRRVEPIAVACLHVTGNPATPPASATAERSYANRAGSTGPSAHFYVDRDGSAVEAIDAALYAAWSNGDVQNPRTDVAGVTDVLGGAGNANEAYAVEIEACGRYPDFPILPVQESTIALIVARRALQVGLPLARSTVHLHSDLNTVTRPNCPVPTAQREAYAARIIGLASDYLEVLRLHETIDDQKAMIAANAATIAGLKHDLATKTEALAQAEQARADAIATNIRWEDYARAAGSHAGSILALDHPDIP